VNRAQIGLLVLAGTAFLLSTDLTMVNVALGPLQQDLQASLTELGWVVDGYSIAMVSLLLVAAPLGERWGQKRVFLLGLVMFGIASLMGARANQITMLISARVLMGLGAALMLAPGQLLTAKLFAPEQRTAAFATWSAAGALGLCLGPLVGGLLVSDLGWRWVFTVNLPVVALGLMVGLKVLPTALSDQGRSLELSSALLSTLGLTLSLGALLQGPAQSWRSPWIWAALVTGLLLVVGFVRRQLRLQEPLLQLRAWQLGPVRQALLGLFAMTISFNGGQFLAVLRLHQQGWSPLAIGSLLAPYALVVWLASRAAAPLARKLGSPPLIRLAFAPLILGLGLLGAPASAALPGLVCGLALMVGGVGQGLLAPVATAQAYNALPQHLLSSGASLAMLARFLGSSLGVALLDALMASSARYDISALAGAALIGACLLLEQTVPSRSLQHNG